MSAKTVYLQPPAKKHPLDSDPGAVSEPFVTSHKAAFSIRFPQLKVKTVKDGLFSLLGRSLTGQRPRLVGKPKSKASFGTRT